MKSTETTKKYIITYEDITFEKHTLIFDNDNREYFFNIFHMIEMCIKNDINHNFFYKGKGYFVGKSIKNFEMSVEEV